MKKTDEDLMVAYVAGDTAGFDTLFSRYAPLLLRIMRRGLFRQEDAPALVQQTFLQLHKARHDYKPSRKLRPWLMTIAYNLKRQYLRTCARRQEVLTDSEPCALMTADPAERRSTAASVRAAIEMLPAGQRDVICMHWFDELSFPEIAAILGLSNSAVKVRAHRGYKVLRAILDDNETAAAA